VSENVPEQAEHYADLFRAVYLTYHRRDGPRSGLTGASRAVLGHLAMSGPLTVGEAARHLDRAQSVVSEIVDQLEAKGLLERERDPADRRRVLVWLTPEGQQVLRRDSDVLGVDRLAAALARLPAEQRTALITATAALVAAAVPEEQQ
jgi:DNA-binding MarR family transcriptional regulator